jgi:hypothetical protein
METLNLGQLITTPQERDAIHIAVIPATCGNAETLMPGQHVGFADKWCVTGNPQAPFNLIGVVDPFLTAPVQPGQRFWMFLYPNTITGLRHNWTHPAISSQGRGMGSDSERWLHDFADSVDAEYEEMMAVAATHCEGSARQYSDYLIDGGKWEGQGTPDEFWTHFQAVTGKKPKGWESEGRSYLPGIFSCSC